MFASAGRRLAAAAVFGSAAIASVGCRKDMAAVQQAPIVDGNATNDPANVNMASAASASQPGYDAAQAARNGYAPRTLVAGESYSQQPENSVETYPAQEGRRTRNEAYNYNTQAPQSYGNQPYDDEDDRLYGELLDANVPVAQQPPPPLPAYEQPEAPGPDYLWTPGYWNYANTGYYYVPGNWVSAPFAGALWTPGWWGYGGGGYRWHHGYWGRHVGYYGGINYGFGFIGFGYQGGYWNNDHFYYNRDANHVDPRVVNNYVYQRNVSVVNTTYINNSRTSYFGGPGGLQRRPQPAEFAAVREAHIAPLPAQIAERQAASQNRQQFFSSNGGRPQQMFAAHPVIERNVSVPAQLARPQGGNVAALSNGFNNGPRPGLNTAPQSQQAVLQQRQAAERQSVQAEQARQQEANLQQQQRIQQEQARQQAMVQGRQQQAMQNQQRMQQINPQHAAIQQNQQRVLQEQQMRNQQFMRQQEQQRAVQQEQQRAAQQQQHAMQQQRVTVPPQHVAAPQPAPQPHAQPQAPHPAPPAAEREHGR